MAEAPLLRVLDVCKTFHTSGRARVGTGRKVRAVDHVTMSLARGETLAVVGESGSGKTTLARLIVGLSSPDSGRLDFLGRPLDWRRPDSR